MGTIRTYDGADQVRVEVIGRFAGDIVPEVENCWKEVMAKSVARTFTIDISRLTGYDSAGRALLTEMNRRGVNIAAKTPSSLGFLQEISIQPRRAPALVRTFDRTWARTSRERRAFPVKPDSGSAAGDR
jgi:ABC-type transporter Mla MlaB component